MSLITGGIICHLIADIYTWYCHIAKKYIKKTEEGEYIKKTEEALLKANKTIDILEAQFLRMASEGQQLRLEMEHLENEKRSLTVERNYLRDRLEQNHIIITNE